jgi:hypothetical protein
MYKHNGASMSRIIMVTQEFARVNPGVVEHSTYIVSFKDRLVTQVCVQGGQVYVVDKGVAQKRKK